MWSTLFYLFFFKSTATPEIYTYCHTLSLHNALPICPWRPLCLRRWRCRRPPEPGSGEEAKVKNTVKTNQSGRIIDAVAHHGNYSTLRLILLHLRQIGRAHV